MAKQAGSRQTGWKFGTMRAAVLLGGAAAVWASAAQAAEVIRPEDEALIADIFAIVKEERAGRHVVQVPVIAGQEDGSGTLIKGARDATRVQAVPLKATREKAAASAEDKTVSVTAAGKAAEEKAKADGGNASVAAESGNNLKDLSKAVVEGKADTAAVAPAEDKAKAAVVATDEAKEDKAVNEAAAYAAEDIEYVYPSKSEREAARQPLREWYNPEAQPYAGAGARQAAGGADEVAGANGVSARDVEADRWRNEISACLDDNQDAVEMEQAMLYKSNTYEAAAYLSQTFAKVNACYENIGYGIINDYYGGAPAMEKEFAEKARRFYVGGADTGFNPAFCGDNCSLAAVANAQRHKFAEFRTYLAALIENRPEIAAPTAEGESAADGAAYLAPENGRAAYGSGAYPSAYTGAAAAYATPATVMQGGEEEILLPDGTTATVSAAEADVSYMPADYWR